MRGARSLYLVHVTLAVVAVALTAAAATAVLAASSLSLPGPAEISAACADWIATSLGSFVGVGAIGLLAAVTVLALRSAIRHSRVARRFVSALPPASRVVVNDTVCERVQVAEPLAFCAGYLAPRVYLSDGLLGRLSDSELRAVVAHEAWHARRRDPLRRLVLRALADGLFFIPILKPASERLEALGELDADRAAVRALGDRRHLAAALLKLTEGGPRVPATLAGVDAERVDQLLGAPDAGRWGLEPTSAVLSVLALVGLTALVAVAAVVEPRLDWPMLLTSGCMSLMIGGPIALAAALLVASQRARRGRHTA